MMVTVLMPVYNADEFLREAIDSILNQTYDEFEFLIINDGSTDSSVNIIESYRDDRIKLVHNTENKGLIKSLNKGIEMAQGKYIVRMDADDIAETNRIETQVNFMENNYDVALAGSNVVIFLSDKPMIKKLTDFPTKYSEIRCKLLFECPIMHPAVIMRKNVLLENNYRYNDEHKDTEDYGLWMEIAMDHKIVNISKKLLRYRIVSNSMTNKALKRMNDRIRVMKKIYVLGLDYLGVEYSEDELDIHAEIALSSTLKHFKYTKKSIEKWLCKLIATNNSIGKYKSEIFNKEIAQQYFLVCVYNGTYIDYKNSEFANSNPKSFFEYMKLKSAVRIKQMVR
jgi:glycosyltransferase involved in cell wall biosynthesis